MAARRVASALHVLTSDGTSGCDEWSDNNAFEALVADYFTGSCDDSSEESDNDDNGTVRSYGFQIILSIQFNRWWSE